MISLLVLLLLLVVLIAFLFATAFYLCSVFPYGRKTPPYVPSSRHIIPHIAEALGISRGSTVYELGAGDMRVSLALWNQEPQARYIGPEKHLWPRLLARWNILRARAHPQVIVREADFYTTDLRSATHIYCYLYPAAMSALFPKFQQELRAGAVVVSLDFPMKEVEPASTIDLKPYRLPLGDTLYVYRF